MTNVLLQTLTHVTRDILSARAHRRELYTGAASISLREVCGL